MKLAGVGTLWDYRLWSGFIFSWFLINVFNQNHLCRGSSLESKKSIYKHIIDTELRTRGKDYLRKRYSTKQGKELYKYEEGYKSRKVSKRIGLQEINKRRMLKRD